MLVCAIATADLYGIQKVGAAWEFTVDGPSVGRTARSDAVGLTYYVPPDAPKPFTDPLLTPAWHSVTTNRSGQAHHHGLWFTWGSLIAADRGESVNFWTTRPGGLGGISGHPNENASVPTP